MEEELSMLKKTLLSLVVSSPTTMTVSRLLKDHRNMVGGVVPHAKFGYREPVPFLNELCNDIFVIEGPSWDPILTPKVTKNLAHIDKMVQNQKVQSSVKHKGKRRSIMPPPVAATPATRFNPPNRYDQPKRLDQPNRYEPPNRYNPPNSFDPQNKYDQQNRDIPSNGLNRFDPQNKYEQQNKDIPSNGLNRFDPQNTYEQENRDIPSNGFNRFDPQNKYDQQNRDIPSNGLNRFDPQNKYEQQNRHIPSNGCNRFDPQNKYEQQNRDIPSNGFHEKNPTNDENKQPFGGQHEILAKPQKHAYPMAKENDDNTKHIDNINDVEDRLRNFYKKRLPQLKADTGFLTDSGQTSKSAESGRLSSTSSGTKQVLLEELEAQIIALIKNSPDGVWCTDLITLYKETYDRELKFSRFGHTRLISLIYRMEDRIVISRPAPDSDWLLQYRSTALAAAAGDTDDDALPGIDFEADVFPPDCLNFLDSIPDASLEGMEPGTTFEVLLGEMYSPSHFWMLRVGPEHNAAMEQIMDEMNEYLNGAGKSRVVAGAAIRVGQYCAALFEGDWHRAVIVRLIDTDTVKVRHVDYGTVVTLPARSLKPLRRAWGALPAQAVRARLAGLRPAAGGWRWPRAACTWFLKRVQHRKLFAHVLSQDLEENIVETFLIDTTDAEHACLTRELIEKEYADARQDSALQSDDSYLYPRFEALESGATPNYSDICRMVADGIRLEYVDEYRQHVPGPWVRPVAPALPPPPPPPPPAAPTPPEEGYMEMRLSAAEWAVLSRLRGADPLAAYWFLLTSAYRDMTAPPPGL